jgi:hypothetical protein
VEVPMSQAVHSNPVVAPSVSRNLPATAEG